MQNLIYFKELNNNYDQVKSIFKTINPSNLENIFTLILFQNLVKVI
jgi:hypothetical protein